MTSGDTGSNDEMMAQLNEQLAPVISNYGTTRGNGYRTDVTCWPP